MSKQLVAVKLSWQGNEPCLRKQNIDVQMLPRVRRREGKLAALVRAPRVLEAEAALAHGGGLARRHVRVVVNQRRTFRRDGPRGRGLHSSTFQLNLSALYGIGGARRGCVAVLRGCQGVCRVCRVFSCVRHGSS